MWAYPVGLQLTKFEVRSVLWKVDSVYVTLSAKFLFFESVAEILSYWTLSVPFHNSVHNTYHFQYSASFINEGTWVEMIWLQRSNPTIDFIWRAIVIDVHHRHRPHHNFLMECTVQVRRSKFLHTYPRVRHQQHWEISIVSLPITLNEVACKILYKHVKSCPMKSVNSSYHKNCDRVATWRPPLKWPGCEAPDLAACCGSSREAFKWPYTAGQAER